MAEPTYRYPEADEQALFDAVTAEHHAWLEAWRIGLVFRDEPRKSKGREVCANAKVLKDAERFITELDGLVEVAEAHWDEEPGWRRYLIDHELSHFSVNNKGKLVIVGHEFEDWGDVLARHDPGVTGIRRLVEGIAGM